MVGAISFYGAVSDDAEGPERLRTCIRPGCRRSAVTFKRDFERHLEMIESQLDPQVIKLLLCDGHRVLWNYADHTEHSTFMKSCGLLPHRRASVQGRRGSVR